MTEVEIDYYIYQHYIVDKIDKFIYSNNQETLIKEVDDSSNNMAEDDIDDYTYFHYTKNNINKILLWTKNEYSITGIIKSSLLILLSCKVSTKRKQKWRNQSQQR